MDRADKTLVITLDRIIQVPPEAAYEAWLDPKVPGTPWNAADKLVLDCKIDGLFYARMSDTPHYGRFTTLAHGREIQHTWMSPYTEGQESLVTVTFTRKDGDTLMSLVHSGLPRSSNGLEHQDGWTFFMDKFPQQFQGKA